MEISKEKVGEMQEVQKEQELPKLSPEQFKAAMKDRDQRLKLIEKDNKWMEANIRFMQLEMMLAKVNAEYYNFKNRHTQVQQPDIPAVENTGTEVGTKE